MSTTSPRPTAWGGRGLAAVVLTASVLAGCGTDDGSTADPAPGAPDDGSVLLLTRMQGFEGEVLTGSELGGEPFCEGGTVTHEQGSPSIGFPAVNVLDCPEGELRIGFGPGPDQMELQVQTSAWEVVEGTGAFAGSTGSGEMEVRWDEVGGDVGHETFEGTLSVPS